MRTLHPVWAVPSLAVLILPLGGCDRGHVPGDSIPGSESTSDSVADSSGDSHSDSHGDSHSESTGDSNAESSSDSGVLPSGGYAYTTNMHGTGATGRAILLGTKSVTWTSGERTDVPCADTTAEVDWSPNGQSLGLARDYTYPAVHTVWASITSKTASDCGATGSGDCIGVARLDPGADPTREFQVDAAGGSVTPDAIANGDSVAVAEKTHSQVYEWTYGGGSARQTPTSASDLSQMEWVDGDAFALTLAGGTSCSSRTQGHVQIVRASTGASLADQTVSLLSGQTTSKPEGIDIVPIDAGHSASCTDGATHVVYVSDYCQDALFVYTWNGTTLTEEASLTLDDATIQGNCSPSNVRYHGPSGQLIVSCQTRGALEFLSVSGTYDQCNPQWDPATGNVPLAYSSSDPSCSATPDTTPCATNGDCSVHDVAWDAAAAQGWVFTNLTHHGETVAMRVDGDHEQTSLYRSVPSPATYEPLEVKIVRSP